MTLILFVKAEQLSLFNAPVLVAGSTKKDGTVIKPYVRVQPVGVPEVPGGKPGLPLSAQAVQTVLVKAGITTPAKLAEVHAQLKDKPLVIAYGAGVDSTAMIFAVHAAGLKPTVITFADTGGEKPETYTQVEKMNVLLKQWDWPLINTVSHVTLATTGYKTLEGNCVDNETLPSIAFHKKSCSIKWKQGPQDQFLMGVSRGPNKRDAHPFWTATKAAGKRITKLIGYDAGKADIRRSAKLATGDENFDYAYPLQTLGWTRAECMAAITAVAGPDMVPVKSACFFCPASKKWELYWLAGHHPELLERSLHMERNAMLGHHSRYKDIEFGASWDKFIETKGTFPSTSTTVGLGMNYAWNQWARHNNVIDKDWKVLRTPEAVARFKALGQPPAEGDNALDQRTIGKNSMNIPLRKAVVLFFKGGGCRDCNRKWVL